MNKSHAVGSLARLLVHLLIHVSVRQSSGTTAAACVSVRLGRVFYTRAFMDCLMAAAYKLDER